MPVASHDVFFIVALGPIYIVATAKESHVLGLMAPALREGLLMVELQAARLSATPTLLGHGSINNVRELRIWLRSLHQRREAVELLPSAKEGWAKSNEARDTRLERTVAIKVLPELAHDPERKARFQREAKAISQLNHPHIAA